MNIAVTAVTGQLGAAIVTALQARNTDANIIGLARTPDKARDLGIEIRPGDYDDRDQLESSLAGVQSLLLVSGNGPTEARIAQHRNVIEAAKTAGVTKIVYTSVQGMDEGDLATPVVKTNRQTEEDVRASGLEYVIGRNGIYIEPDVEYIETYRKEGEIVNCAGDGRCGYTTRPELAAAYAGMLLGEQHNGNTYLLHGECITQSQLATYLNSAFGTELTYRAMSAEDYYADRVTALGELFGKIIASIYEGIHQGALDKPSDYEQAAGRPHQSWEDYFASIAAD
ncbi:MAG: SDR family oxidoreductase [Pseudomonadota bacterium]